MTRRDFWNLIPHPVRIAACAIVCTAVLIGLIAGTTHSHFHHGCVSPMLQSLFGIGLGLLIGSFVAIWILCLGFVFADARRRAMPPILWTLIAALVPNLLGFLFYFALRRPLVLLCTQCGQPGESGRFCSACGFDKLSSTPGSAHSA
jgi:hypothetical protein